MNAPFLLLMNELPWAGPIARRVTGSDVMLNCGQPLDVAPGPFAFELRVDPSAPQPLDFPPLDWHDPAGGQPLFSQRMMEVLHQAGVSNLECYPATVHCVPSGATLDYSVVNVLGLVEGLDHAASRIVRSARGRIIGLEALRLDPSRLEGHDLVRLREQPDLLVVSARLATRLGEAGLTGLRLLPDHAWRPGMI